MQSSVSKRRLSERQIPRFVPPQFANRYPEGQRQSVRAGLAPT